MRSRNPIFRPARPHSNHFLRAQVCRKKSQPRDPRGYRSPGKEKIRARLHVLLQHKPDSQHESEIQQDNRVIDQMGFWSHLISFRLLVSHLYLPDSSSFFLAGSTSRFFHLPVSAPLKCPEPVALASPNPVRLLFFPLLPSRPPRSHFKRRTIPPPPAATPSGLASE